MFQCNNSPFYSWLTIADTVPRLLNIFTSLWVLHTPNAGQNLPFLNIFKTKSWKHWLRALLPPPLKKERRYVHLRTSYETVWLTSFLVLWLPRHCQRTASTAPALIGPYWHGWLTPSVAQTVSSRSTVSAARCRALPTAKKNLSYAIVPNKLQQIGVPTRGSTSRRLSKLWCPSPIVVKS